ncbi:MAG TPA: AtpZ/AtpI family protein [Phycisphaerae bacterium]|nr:AtpZ/AtpI family protein [Phycisphaerae bacterium]
MVQDRQDGSRPRRRAWPGWTRYAGMGTEFAGAIIGLTLLGLWVDWHWKTSPAGVLFGGSLGIVGGGYNFIKQALRLMKTQVPTSKDNEAANGNDRTERP